MRGTSQAVALKEVHRGPTHRHPSAVHSPTQASGGSPWPVCSSGTRSTDWGQWKDAFDAHQHEREAFGISGHSVHRDPDDATTIIVAMRTDDLARAREFAASESLRHAMETAGVQGAPEIWFAEDVEDKRY